MHGATLPQVLDRNTLRSLIALRGHSLLSDGEFTTLRRAYLFLREQVSTARWIGIVLIVFGVVLINRTPHRTTPQGTPN